MDREYITSTFAIDGSPSIIAAGREKSGDLVDYDKHLIDIIEFCKEKGYYPNPNAYALSKKMVCR